jgi:hypothetical protein
MLTLLQRTTKQITENRWRTKLTSAYLHPAVSCVCVSPCCMSYVPCSPRAHAACMLTSIAACLPTQQHSPATALSPHAHPNPHAHINMGHRPHASRSMLPTLQPTRASTILYYQLSPLMCNTTPVLGSGPAFRNISFNPMGCVAALCS